MRLSGRNFPYEDINEPIDTNEWSVSYGDVISLLLTFFILLFSIAQVSQKKYERILDAIQGNMMAETSVEQLYQDVKELIEANQLEQSLELQEDELGVIISIKDKILFQSGSADIDVNSARIIDPLIAALRKLPQEYNFEIEGHTDNVPINTQKFPSNWYLSSYRALAMLDIFIRYGFEENRFQVQGFADQQPLLPNEDSYGNPIPENHSANRRIVIKVR